MKVLACEMCNSRDVIKEDDCYVCQSCGTKYSVEAAKKLMVEGTVKVDNTEMVAKSLENARRAKQKEDWEETEKYYNLVEQNDPSNIEAIFYSSYGKARSTLPVNEIYVRESVFKALVKSADVIDENFDIEKSEELFPMLEQIATDAIGLFGVAFVYTQTKNGYGIVTGDDRNKTYQLFINVVCGLSDSYINILNKFPEDAKPQKVFMIKQILRLLKSVASCSYASKEGREKFVGFYEQYVNLLKTVDPSCNVDAHMEWIANCKTTINKDETKKLLKGLAYIAIGLAVGAAIVAYYIFA